MAKKSFFNRKPEVGFPRLAAGNIYSSAAWRGLAALMLSFSLVMMGCSTGDDISNPTPSYQVVVSSATQAVLQGGTGQFSVTFKKDGTELLPGQYSTVWSVSGSDNSIDQSGTLTVGASASGTLTVTATVSYPDTDGPKYYGTATVTVKTAAEAAGDFRVAAEALSGASSAAALLNALNTLDTYLDSYLLNSDMDDVYYDEKDEIASKVAAVGNASETGVNEAINELNNYLLGLVANKMLSDFSSAADANEVKALIDKYFSYGIPDFEESTPYYNRLSDTYKEELAKRVKNAISEGRITDIDQFVHGLSTDVIEEYLIENTKEPLDAMLDSAANGALTLARIKAFVEPLKDVGIEFDINESDVPGIQTFLQYFIKNNDVVKDYYNDRDDIDKYLSVLSIVCGAIGLGSATEISPGIDVSGFVTKNNDAWYKFETLSSKFYTVTLTSESNVVATAYEFNENGDFQKKISSQDTLSISDISGTVYIQVSTSSSGGPRSFTIKYSEKAQ